MERDELMYPYEHPYKAYMPVAWRRSGAQRMLLAGGGGGLVCLALLLATGSGRFAALGVSAVVFACLAVALWMAAGARVIARRAGEWDVPSELERVRARRPHAAERDAALVHDEFAVTVEDSGQLCIWRLRPLGATEDEQGEELLIPGRPRHAAQIVEVVDLEHDSAAAASLLADTQERAAELERAAIGHALAQADRDRDEAQRRLEAGETAAALKHLTGQ